MKRLIMITGLFLLMMFAGCQNTSDCTNELDFILDQSSVKMYLGDTLELPYHKMLITKSYSYSTEIKSDTLFGEDTVVVWDTLFTDPTLHLIVESDTSFTNYIMSEDDEIENGHEEIGEDFDLIKLHLEHIVLTQNPDSGFVYFSIYKGVFYSDCSSW